MATEVRQNGIELAGVLEAPETVAVHTEHDTDIEARPTSDEHTRMLSSNSVNDTTTITGGDVIVVSSSEDSVATVKRGIWKNHLILCLVFMLLLSAHVSFEGLQSSLNSDESLGTVGLTLVYLVFCATTLLLVVFTTSRYSNKRILVVSIVPYVLYLCTGFYSTWATVIPAAVVYGIAAGHMWVAQQAYITTLTKQYAAITNTKFEDVNNLFFGILSGFLALRHIWGNLASSVVLLKEPSNQTNILLESCGIDYCPRNLNSTVVQPPSQQQLYTYTGVLVGFDCLALGIAALFLTDISDIPTPEDRPTPAATARAVLVHIYRSREQKLMAPMSVYRGMEIAFLLGHFNMAFVSCPLGIGYVGLVTIAFGTTSSMLSFLVGKLAKYTGVIPLYVIAFLAHGSAGCTMLLWKLDPNNPEIIFAIMVLWGVGDAVIATLVESLYSSMFQGSVSKTAYSTFRLLVSLGYATSFALASCSCMSATVVFMLVWLTISVVCMIVLNWHRTCISTDTVEIRKFENL